MRRRLRPLAAAALAASLWTGLPALAAQPPPRTDDVRAAPENESNEESVGATGFVVGLLGAGVALALVITAHSLWVVRRRKGERLEDADDSVQRLGR
jgi:hypothetical protein